MTKKFDIFLNNILKESFADLPDELPHGFWINSSGEIFPVPYQGHAKIALNVIKKVPKYKKRLTDLVDGIRERAVLDFYAQTILLINGWVKCTVEQNGYVSTIYYKTYENKKPSPKAEGTLIDLQIFYGLTIQRDTSKI